MAKKNKTRRNKPPAKNLPYLSPLRLTDLEEWEEVRKDKIIDRNVRAINGLNVGQMQALIIMEKANAAAQQLTALSYAGVQEMNTVGGSLTLLWLSLKKKNPDMLLSEVEDNIDDLQLAKQKLLQRSDMVIQDAAAPPTRDIALIQLKLLTGDIDLNYSNCGERVQSWMDQLEEKKTKAPVG